MLVRMIYSDPKSARTINRLRVLNELQRNPGLSRAGLSRELLLNKVSISEIVQLLLEEGLIVETGKSSGAGRLGRTPVDLEIDRLAVSIMAIDLGMTSTTIAVAGTMGDLLWFERFPTPVIDSPESLVRTLSGYAAKLRQRMRRPETAAGIAITLNASLDQDSGGVRSFRGERWLDRFPHQVSLQRSLSDRLGLPVTCEGNVRSMILGERWFGDISADQAIFYINWGQSIGSAQMIGNRILSVESEFRHTPVTTEHVCSCGKTGCLEAVSSGAAIQRLGNDLQGRSSSGTEIPTTPRTVRQLYQESHDDTRLQALFHDAATAMGQAIAIASGIVRPDRVIIGGGLANIDDSLFRVIKESFALHAPAGTRSSTLISRTPLGDRAGILGTTALGLNAFVYRRSELDLLQSTQL